MASPNVTLPSQCSTLLCQYFTALIGSDQCHAHASRCFSNHSYAGAHLSSTVPLRRKSMLCQSVSPHCHFGALTLIAIPMLSHSMPKHIVSMPDRSYLFHNDTCLNSAMPLRLNALLCRGYTCPCQCSATPLVCYSMPKHCITIQCRNQALPISALPMLCSSYPCHRLNVLYSAHALKLTARALHHYSMPLRR